MLIKEVRTFKHGVIDTIEAQSIPDGAASSSLNWITKGDKIELRGGFLLMGTDVGVGKVTGLFVGKKADGTNVLFRSRARKIEYYDRTTSDWIEVSTTNVLPAAASGEDVSFTGYQGLSGAFVYASSPNSSIYKIPTANPGSIVDMSSTTYRGYIAAKTGRMYLWNRKGSTGVKDDTGLFMSYIDKDEISDFTNVAAEARHNGDGATRTFTGTLAAKGGGAKRTCFGVSITDSTETFTDDRNGVLTGSAGGTGTINYATMAYSVTFAVAPIVGVNNITATYYWEDSTSAGVCDFTYTSPTRTTGQGNFLRQDDGGGRLMAALTYGGAEYCLHQFKTWVVTLGSDGEPTTNKIYREQVGTPNWRAAVATGEGIYYIDNRDTEEPKIRLLTLDSISAQVIPVPISNNLQLSGYRFDQAAGGEYGDYIIFDCRTSDSTTNNRMLVYNRIMKTWDVVDFYSTIKAVYDGALVVGDTVTGNVYQVFSGSDDDGAGSITNHWDSNLTRLQVEELKKVKKLILNGSIGSEQSISVWLNLDRGGWTQVGLIEGSGAYVDRTQAITIGSLTFGSAEIGGGGDGITAYNYYRQINLSLDKFDEVQIRFVAEGLGYASVSAYRFHDIRRKSPKLPSKYRV